MEEHYKVHPSDGSRTELQWRKDGFIVKAGQSGTPFWTNAYHRHLAEYFTPEQVVKDEGAKAAFMELKRQKDRAGRERKKRRNEWKTAYEWVCAGRIVNEDAHGKTGYTMNREFGYTSNRKNSNLFTERVGRKRRVYYTGGCGDYEEITLYNSESDYMYYHISDTHPAKDKDECGEERKRINDLILREYIQMEKQIEAVRNRLADDGFSTLV